MDTSLLAGSKFEYSTDDGVTFIELLGLTEFPEFKDEREDEETTEVRDTQRKYQPGLDSPTEQTITARYYKADADQLAFRTLARNRGTCSIKVTYSDGDILAMDVQLKNYGIAGGAAADRKSWTVTLRRTTVVTHTESVS